MIEIKIRMIFFKGDEDEIKFSFKNVGKCHHKYSFKQLVLVFIGNFSVTNAD
jgi:hypothetical protein